MRRAVYIKALEEASKLPTEITELGYYFKDFYNPKFQAFEHIKRMACSDTLLHTHEIADVLTWKETDAKDNHDCSTKQAKA